MISIQSKSTTTLSSTTVEGTTEKFDEVVLTDSTITLTTTAITSSSETTTTTDVSEIEPTTTGSSTETTTTTDVSETETTTSPFEFTTTAMTTTVSDFTTTDAPETESTTPSDESETESSTIFPETSSTESSTSTSTVETTTNDVNLSTETKLNDLDDHYPHSDKPQSLLKRLPRNERRRRRTKSNFSFIESTNAALVNDEFLHQIIVLLAEYIKNHTNIESPEPIVHQLKDKLDQSQLNVTEEGDAGIHGTVELLLKDLPMIIQTVVSSVEIVEKFSSNVFRLFNGYIF